MDLDWSALGQVTAVSIAVTVAVVVVFALGVLGLARHEGAREEGAHEDGGGTSSLGAAQAGLCFLACAAVVAYGIYLIVPQFH
ncbi:hypothetical protein AB0H97_15210 [Streptomyces sp. NPDC050788]|uniref:hypothetical protein n=1 Tax=Streptomyces sp. NPDC050788 TaxID=3155041 RepID=UPI0034207CF7